MARILLFLRCDLFIFHCCESLPVAKVGNVKPEMKPVPVTVLTDGFTMIPNKESKYDSYPHVAILMARFAIGRPSTSSVACVPSPEPVSQIAVDRVAWLTL